MWPFIINSINLLVFCLDVPLKAFTHLERLPFFMGCLFIFIVIDIYCLLIAKNIKDKSDRYEMWFFLCMNIIYLVYCFHYAF